MTALPKWTPFRLAQTLRCLQQGTLNVGNTFQNRANLLALALANANGLATWAKWRAGFGANGGTLGNSTTTGAGLLLNVPSVPGFVASAGSNDSEV